MRLALGVFVALVVMVPRAALAQVAAGGPSDDARIIVDVNLVGAAASLAKDREFQSRAITFGEIQSSIATYPEPSRAITFLDVGGSFRLSRWFAAGVAYSRTEHEDAAALQTTVPHPTFLAAPATTAGVTGEQLSRTEGATSFFFAVVPLRIKGAAWRVFGGPTIFSINAQMVNSVLYAQTFDPLSPQQAITITGFTTSRAKGTDVGFHLGTDVTVFLTKVVGIGGGVRFSRGTISFDEPLSRLRQEVRVGNTLGFVGLRFRLGR